MTEYEYLEDDSNMTEEKVIELDRKINNYTKKTVKINTRIRSLERELSDLREEKRQIKETIESLGFRRSWSEYGIEQKEKT